MIVTSAKVAIVVGLFMTVTFTAWALCSRSARDVACNRIKSAGEMLSRGENPEEGIRILESYCRSGDSFVRTQAILMARNLGPNLDDPWRERCMLLVGGGINDPSGYVQHVAIPGIGYFGESADGYVDELLKISMAPHLPNAIFAIESLGRIGDSRPEVGERLVQATTERWNLADGEDYPLRLTALWALESWGDKARPWARQLRIVRDSLEAERETGVQRPGNKLSQKDVATRSRSGLALDMLSSLIGELERKERKGDAK